LLDEHDLGLLKQLVLVVSKVEVATELVGIFLIELMITGILSHLESIAHGKQLLTDSATYTLDSRLVKTEYPLKVILVLCKDVANDTAAFLGLVA
jgi:hypothetical protein